VKNFLEIFPATLVSRATRNQTDPLAPLWLLVAVAIS
jgi:hypothetical protein